MAKAKSKETKSVKVSKSTIRIKKPNIKFKFTKPDFGNLKKYTKPALTVLVVLMSFVLVDFFVQYLNNDYSIAVVNGSRISKRTYHAKLENLYGQSVARQLIDEAIIKQEAKKAEVEATEEEVQERLDEIIRSIGGQEAYETALTTNNLTEQEVRNEIALEIITRKILEPLIEYTEEDVKAFFDQYSANMFPNETKALEEGEKLNYEQFKEQTKDIYLKQEVDNKRYTWIDGLYTEYKIQNNSTEKPKYGILTTTINIFRSLFENVNTNEK